MIRDPSDGSEYEPPKPVLDTGTTGMPIASTKAKDVERLEKSRKWLEEYYRRAKEST